MTPDFEEYRQYVDHFDLTEARKVELVLMVWRIMESFVDRAYGDDPVQQVSMKLGKDGVVKDAMCSGPVIDFTDQDYHALDLTRTFEKRKGGK